jgi:hypothetical protein
MEGTADAEGPAPPQVASADRLTDKVVAGINGPFLSPLGSQHIAPPGAGGGDLTLPATIIIIVERP